MSDRTRLWNMRIDPETDKRLNTLAVIEDRSAAATVRHLINQAWEAYIARQRVRITESGQQVLEEARESSTTE